MRRRAHETLKFAFAPIMLRIRSGPLRGKRWSVTTGGAFITGRCEPEKTAGIAREVRAGDVVYDIGAHVGYFTVLMSESATALAPSVSTRAPAPAPAGSRPPATPSTPSAGRSSPTSATP